MANASAQLHEIAARLKAAGEVGIRRETVKSLKTAAAPLIPAARAAARERLPKAGGLNEKVAGQPIKVSVKTGARTAGVSIRAQFTRTDAGTWRHPVFADGSKTRQEWRWVEQSYETASSWFEDAMRAEAPAAQVAMNGILATVAAEIQRMGI